MGFQRHHQSLHRLLPLRQRWKALSHNVIETPFPPSSSSPFRCLLLHAPRRHFQSATLDLFFSSECRTFLLNSRVSLYPLVYNAASYASMAALKPEPISEPRQKRKNGAETGNPKREKPAGINGKILPWNNAGRRHPKPATRQRREPRDQADLQSKETTMLKGLPHISSKRTERSTVSRNQKTKRSPRIGVYARNAKNRTGGALIDGVALDSSLSEVAVIDLDSKILPRKNTPPRSNPKSATRSRRRPQDRVDLKSADSMVKGLRDIISEGKKRLTESSTEKPLDGETRKILGVEAEAAKPATDGRRKAWRNTHFSQLLKREEAANSMQKLLMEAPWDEAMKAALEKIGLLKSTVVLCKVLKRMDVPIDKCESFFNWLKHQKGLEMTGYVYNSMIKRLGKAGLIEKMESVVSDCISDGQQSSATLSTVLSVYKGCGNLEAVLEVWIRMKASGVRPNPVAYTLLVDTLCSHGRYKEAGGVLDQMLEEGWFPTVWTWTMLINYLVGDGKMEAALQVLKLMPSIGVNPNVVTYSVVMKGYAREGDVARLVELAEEMREYGNRPSKLYTVICDLEESGKAGPQDIERVLAALWPDVEAGDRRKWLEGARTNGGEEDLAEEDDDDISDDVSSDKSSDEKGALVTRLLRQNKAAFADAISPWTPALAASLARLEFRWDAPFAFKVLKHLKNKHTAWSFFNWVKEQPGFKHDYFTYSRMISLLLSSGDFALVRDLLKAKDADGVCLSVHTYNTIIKNFSRGRHVDAAAEVFEMLTQSGLEPSELTFKHLIKGLVAAGDLEKANTFLSKMTEAGLIPEAGIYSLLMNAYGKAGHLEELPGLLRRMQASGVEPTEATYRTLIRSHFLVGNLFVAEKYFRRMKASGIAPSRETYALMSIVMSRAGRHGEAKSLNEQSKLADVAASVESDEKETCHAIIKLFVDSLSPS